MEYENTGLLLGVLVSSVPGIGGPLQGGQPIDYRNKEKTITLLHKKIASD